MLTISTLRHYQNQLPRPRRTEFAHHFPGNEITRDEISQSNHNSFIRFVESGHVMTSITFTSL